MHDQDSREDPPPEMAPAESLTADATGKTLLDLLDQPGSDLAEAVRQLVTDHEYRQDTVNNWGSFLQ
jgi:hypothetical protein